ncbi:hypothetical protein EPA93_43750 [Ktedonosporobacter rubrisoli]|uniref:Uncharacterized protein n=1 Tax=Ktedonosporobacter rubrisoli TaxID=2509675 RepID=A0A4P6K3I3_KTERU|nr:hypothetical protein [Ktedonosporobacter rubrisoli]QBD82522.1 hypothetical protein EPA93_43750 [Ktedonosporobacter rubrisoli]
MSTELPRLEARIGAQERMATILHARIEELSQDVSASLKQLAEHQTATERKRYALSQDMTTSLKQLAQYQIATRRQF